MTQPTARTVVEVMLMSITRIVGRCALLMLLSVGGVAAGRSDLVDAAMKGDQAAVRTLLEQHADVNVPQADGATALHWAVFRGDKEMVDILIRAGANVKAANREGATPLSLACTNGDAAIIAALVNAAPIPTSIFRWKRLPS